MYMISAVIMIVALAVAVCLLHLRLRFELSPERRCLFLGLGRSGPEFDYIRRIRTIKLFGLTVRVSPLHAKRDEPTREPEPEKKPRPMKPGRERPWRDLLRILPQCGKALSSYLVALLNSLIIEELEADVRGGFESPDLTGQAFGYYQAALAVAPAVVGRFRFSPDWMGPSLDGRARVSVAIPVSRLLHRSFVLLWSLPLRQLVRLAIGKKKGGLDG